MAVRPGHEIAAVIAEYAPGATLEWASVRTIQDDSDKLKYPFTGFRLSQPSEPLIAVISAAVSTFHGQEKWCMKRAPSKRDNYIIKPQFVDALTRDLATQSLRVRTEHIAESAPNRCRAANVDVPELARHIGQELRRFRREWPRT